MRSLALSHGSLPRDRCYRWDRYKQSRCSYCVGPLILSCQKCSEKKHSTQKLLPNQAAFCWSTWSTCITNLNRLQNLRVGKSFTPMQNSRLRWFLLIWLNFDGENLPISSKRHHNSRNILIFQLRVSKVCLQALIL